MRQTISWHSGCQDEMELVYERAEREEHLGAELEALECQALEEARRSCGLLRTAEGPLTPEQFDAMPASAREQVLCRLGRAGVAGMDLDLPAAAVHVKLSPLFGQVMACSIFVLLNSLEKLDGGFSERISGQATLTLHVPLGARRGLMRWEMLLMGLYPWIKCREEASDQAAVSAPTAGPAQASPAVTPEEKAAAAPQKPEKRGFLARLFGKK